MCEANDSSSSSGDNDSRNVARISGGGEGGSSSGSNNSSSHTNNNSSNSGGDRASRGTGNGNGAGNSNNRNEAGASASSGDGGSGGGGGGGSYDDAAFGDPVTNRKEECARLLRWQVRYGVQPWSAGGSSPTELGCSDSRAKTAGIVSSQTILGVARRAGAVQFAPTSS